MGVLRGLKVNGRYGGGIIAEDIRRTGSGLESTICMEEMAELIQAISKVKRPSSNDAERKAKREHLIEEMADVLICLEILQQVYHVTDARLASEAAYKLSRTMRRWGEPTQSEEAE